MRQPHAPAYFIYYLAGRSYNDIEYFDGRKAEFSPAEMERKKKQEHRQKQIALMYYQLLMWNAWLALVISSGIWKLRRVVALCDS